MIVVVRQQPCPASLDSDPGPIDILLLTFQSSIFNIQYAAKGMKDEY
jgi:hypothetical protein